MCHRPESGFLIELDAKRHNVRSCSSEGRSRAQVLPSLTLVARYCMRIMNAETAIAIVVFLATVTALLYRLSHSRSLPSPPGPPPRFWSGNAHQIPTTEPWLTYASWSKTYGPIISFRIFSRKIVMLNSGKAALDLLESRSAIYSDRPFAWMFGELIGRKFSIFMTSFFDPRFKKYRRMLQSGLNPRAVQSYRHIQEEELRVLLKNLAEKPESFSKHDELEMLPLSY